MSHSVFRDLDDHESSGNGAEVADNNLIVFIHKDGGVQVDPNALQDLIGEFLVECDSIRRKCSMCGRCRRKNVF